jgi:integrase
LRVHTRKRGDQFHYVCRVPRDLQHLFPTVQLTQSLKTDDERAAKVAATAIEYRTQQLFLQLRTGMLSKDLEKHLIARFLKRGLENLEAVAEGRPEGRMKDIEEVSLALSRRAGHSPEEAKEFLAIIPETRASLLKRDLQVSDTSSVDPQLAVVAAYLKEHHGIKLSAAEKKSLSLKYLNAAKQLNEAQSAVYRGEWSPMELLKEKVMKDLSSPYYDLKTVLEKYQEYYINSKPNVKKGTQDDMAVECRVLLEILGNISISDFNSMDAVTKLKGILLRFPKNKQQRYGDKSIHAILKTEKLYEKIDPKTANNYIDRARAVVKFAGKNDLLTNAANVYEGERFATSKAAEEERAAYDSGDVSRLIDAICTKPLQGQNPPYPERFWIVLIALFHGLRLGNIVELTKEDICQTDRGMWIFDLRRGKTKATVRPVAICDTLLLLGFLEWVEQLPRKNLFQDSSRSFSAWYNRDEVRNGKRFQGFESRYITEDKAKCLYSIRHHFAGNVFEVTEDFKITSDMMGHSTGHKVTARYTKATKAEALKEVTEKMQMEHIDLDRLDARAKELFGY